MGNLMAEGYESPPTDLMIRRTFEFPWARRKRLRAWQEWTSQHWDREPTTNSATETTLKVALEEPEGATGIKDVSEAEQQVAVSSQPVSKVTAPTRSPREAAEHLPSSPSGRTGVLHGAEAGRPSQSDGEQTEDMVRPGMTVTVRFEGDEDEVTFLLASRVQPNMPIDVYSPRSPLGSAILGKREGDSATYALPNGRSLTVEILNVVPYPGLQSSEAEQSGTIGSSGRRLPGLLIAFEGGEGVGKSTQARLLAIWLRDRGYDVVSTHEPGATKVGMRLRALLLDTANTGLSPLAEALMYAADRAQHVASVIEPALDRDAIVITDRYIDSSLAYQGAGRNLPVEEIATFNRQATGGLFPDLTILLDMDPIAAQQRRSPSADRLEAEPAEFHKRVRTGFLALAREEPSRYLVLDADRPPDEITRDIQRRMHGMLLDPDQLHVTQRRARSAAPPQ